MKKREIEGLVSENQFAARSGVKFHRGCALRAISKLSAEPRACSMGGDYE